MLKVFRDNLKYLSWVLWLVIAVFILFVFVDFGGTVPGSAAAPTAAAVTVGSQKITYGEFQTAYDQFESFYRQSMGDQFSRELARQMGLPVQVLNRLIADRILTEEGRRMGLTVTDEELRDEILRQFGGNFVGEEQYARVLRSNGTSPEAFEASLRRDLLAQKVRQILADNIYVPEAEVERAYRDRVERAKIRYVKLATADLSGEVSVRPDETQAFFDANRDEYRIPERRVATYLLVDRQAIVDELEIGEAEVAAYYDENQEEFTVEEQVQARHILVQVPDESAKPAARARIEEARRKIEEGAPFAEVAREYSADPGSKDRGGDLGYFGRGAMVPPFENAAFGAEVGALVGPVETDFGFHLIEVLDKRPGGGQPLAEVEDLIRQRLAATRGAAAAEARARELADRIDRENLSAGDWQQLAIEANAVTVETTEPFARDDYIAGVGSATLFANRAFELSAGEVSEPISLGTGWAVLTVDSIEEPRIPELDEVLTEVETAALEEKRAEIARERLARTVEALADDEGLDVVAEQLELEPVESPLFGRRDAIGALGRNPEITAAALELAEGELGGPIPVEGGALVFEVVERQRFDAGRFAEERDGERQALADERFAALLESLIIERREELGVSYDPQLVANFELAEGAGS